MTHEIWTVGHSRHTAERFLDLLRLHHVSALADVRSHPHSRYNPQFDRKTLSADLAENGVAYVFLGKHLGARSEDRACYENGKVQYDRLALTDSFQEGLKRLEEGSQRYRVAMMCAEKDPLECHRTILIARQLRALGWRIHHILEDGSIETHDHAMGRLLKQLKMPDEDLLRSHEQLVEEAYDVQGQRIAYKLTDEALAAAAE